MKVTGEKEKRQIKSEKGGKRNDNKKKKQIEKREKRQ
jgi:hypothetical protein